MATPLIASLLLAAAAASQGGGVYAVVQGPKGTVKASLFSDKYADLTIAQVDGRAVTLRELTDALATSHVSHGKVAASKPGHASKDYTGVLDRLIGVRLITLEAHDMGLDDLPEVKAEMEKYATSGLREGLKAKLTAGIVASPAEVDKLYKDAVREWKVRSVLLADEAKAKEFLAAARGKAGWDAAVKGAKVREEPQVISESRRPLAAVLDAVAKAKQGAVLGPVRVEKGFAALLVDAISYPDNPRKRQEAAEQAVQERKAKALNAMYGQLVKKLVTMDRKVLDAVDFEAKEPGFEALLKDKRVLAGIKGGEDITVADLAAGISAEFFHSMDHAIVQKKVNAKKTAIFNSLLYQRLFDAEAKRQGIGETLEYKRAVDDHHDALVFGKFVEKAVIPDVKVTEGEAFKHYQSHKGDYSFPAFYTLSSIAFDNAASAQVAFDKLRGGTDFKWLKSNATGLLAESKRDFDFDGSTVSARQMPKDLGALLATAKPGDVRLYAAQDGGHYVMSVKAVTPSTPQPYEEVREQAVRAVQQLRIKAAVDEWIAKLRKARDVKVYISQILS